MLSAAAQASFGEGRPAPEMDSLFRQTNGWIGGDGVYSVALSEEKTLWLFSDTWIGSVREGKRVGARLVNNTLALQDGHGPGARLQFVIHRDGEGQPMAFVKPADERGWFWLQSAACVSNRLFLFLTQIEKSGDPSVFGFRQIGQWLGIVTNPLAPPLEWHFEQCRLPCAEFSSERHRTFGAATLLEREYLYIYGTDEDIRRGEVERYLTVARVPISRAADFSAWRYYAGGEWDVDYRKATRIADRMASECSVTFLQKPGRYVLVYTDRGLSPKIELRTSSTPWGTWSNPSTVYQCPEMDKDKRVFCYAAKAHPSEGTGDALMISYVANSYDVGQVIADASLYWPRFVRVQLAPAK